MNLYTLVQETLDQLPTSCKGDPGVHEWEISYGDPNLEFQMQDKRFKKGEQMLPYYVCKYCYAVSTDFTTNPSPKRAR